MKHFYPILPYDLKQTTKRSISLLFTLDGILELLDWIYLSFIHGKEAEEKVKKPLDLSSLQEIFSEKKEKVEAIGFYLLGLIKTSKIEGEKAMQRIDEIHLLLTKIDRSLFLDPKKDFSHFVTMIYEKLLFLFDDLFPFFQEAKANENLLFYLIEHQKRWDLHLKGKTIQTILQSLFYSSFSELRAVIQEGYTRRGFSCFYEKQEELIEGLEWDEVQC